MDGPYFLPQLLVERTGLQDVTWGLLIRVALTEGRFSYSYSFEVGPYSTVSLPCGGGRWSTELLGLDSVWGRGVVYSFQSFLEIWNSSDALCASLIL